MIRGVILRWGVNAVAIWVAFRFVPGVTPVELSVEAVIVNALIFGLVNAFIRPLMKFMSCPLIILTLGLGTLLINTLMFDAFQNRLRIVQIQAALDVDRRKCGICHVPDIPRSTTAFRRKTFLTIP